MHFVQLVRLFIISLLLINFNVFKDRAIFYSVTVFYHVKKKEIGYISVPLCYLHVTYRIPIKSTPFFAGLKFTLREELYNYE